MALLQLGELLERERVDRPEQPQLAVELADPGLRRRRRRGAAAARRPRRPRARRRGRGAASRPPTRAAGGPRPRRPRPAGPARGPRRATRSAAVRSARSPSRRADERAHLLALPAAALDQRDVVGVDDAAAGVDERGRGGRARRSERSTSVRRCSAAARASASASSRRSVSARRSCEELRPLGEPGGADLEIAPAAGEHGGPGVELGTRLAAGAGGVGLGCLARPRARGRSRSSSAMRSPLGRATWAVSSSMRTRSGSSSASTSRRSAPSPGQRLGRRGEPGVVGVEPGRESSTCGGRRHSASAAAATSASRRASSRAHVGRAPLGLVERGGGDATPAAAPIRQPAAPKRSPSPVTMTASGWPTAASIGGVEVVDTDRRGRAGRRAGRSTSRAVGRTCGPHRIADRPAAPRAGAGEQPRASTAPVVSELRSACSARPARVRIGDDDRGRAPRRARPRRPAPSRRRCAIEVEQRAEHAVEHRRGARRRRGRGRRRAPAAAPRPGRRPPTAASAACWRAATARSSSASARCRCALGPLDVDDERRLDELAGVAVVRSAAARIVEPGDPLGRARRRGARPRSSSALDALGGGAPRAQLAADLGDRAGRRRRRRRVEQRRARPGARRRTLPRRLEVDELGLQLRRCGRAPRRARRRSGRRRPRGWRRRRRRAAGHGRARAPGGARRSRRRGPRARSRSCSTARAGR